MKKKKSLTVLLITILMLSVVLSLTGCRESFGMKNVREQIENNLGWHRGGSEICEYDVFDGDSLVGSYTSEMRYFYNTDVGVETSVAGQNRKLEKFSGYAFFSEMSAQVDGKEYKRYTQSFTGYDLAPILSYTKETLEQSVEIITAYENKKARATFIIDGVVTEDTAKTKAAILCDNSYVYQFARATDLNTALSISVPTYTANSEKTAVSASTFTTSCISGLNVVLDKNFVIERDFTLSGETTDGAPYGVEDAAHKAVEKLDDDGNTTVTYSLTCTKIIPAYRFSFATTNSSLTKGYIYCYISSCPMRNEDGNNLANRVIVMMQEGKMTYKLKSIVRNK